jgi:hypothetical protein
MFLYFFNHYSFRRAFGLRLTQLHAGGSAEKQQKKQEMLACINFLIHLRRSNGTS